MAQDAWGVDMIFNNCFTSSVINQLTILFSLMPSAAFLFRTAKLEGFIIHSACNYFNIVPATSNSSLQFAVGLP